MYILNISNLPSILTCNDGSRVTAVEGWETKRRSEIYDFFADQVYGRIPELEFEVSHTKEREKPVAS